MGARIEIIDQITKYRIFTDSLCPHLTKRSIIAQLEDCAGQLSVEQITKREKNWLIVIAVANNRREQTLECISERLQQLGLIENPLKAPKLPK